MHTRDLTRPALLVLIAVLEINRILLTKGSEFIVNSEKDQVMDDKFLLKILNISRQTVEHCLQNCLESCLCVSFQICNTTECHLCSSNKYINPSALRHRKGCTNFVFQRQNLQENYKQCSHSCSTMVNCCIKSNPCLNGGTCLPPDSTQSRRRFSCKCPDGYAGDHCQQPIMSCRGYSKGTRVTGKYMVFDVTMKLFKVFCDFDSNSSTTWTLIQSYQRHVDVKGLFDDMPLNQENPSWNKYRLTKSRMESIQNDSTKWRITCQYQKHMQLVSSEYVRGESEKMDILIRNFGCFTVEYINVRGYSCSNCTAFFWQSNIYPLHFYSFTRNETNCDFRPPVGYNCADYFGAYDCLDRKHSCSESSKATTQIWFGGQ